MTHGGQHDIDPQFTALPLRALADAAMQQAADLGAGHADFRAEQLRSQTIGLSDGNLETLFSQTQRPREAEQARREAARLLDTTEAP